jgi:hypothetical protein
MCTALQINQDDDETFENWSTTHKSIVDSLKGTNENALKYIEDLINYKTRYYEKIFTAKLPSDVKNRTPFNNGRFANTNVKRTGSSTGITVTMKGLGGLGALGAFLKSSGGGKKLKILDTIYSSAMFGGGIVDNVIIGGNVSRAKEFDDEFKRAKANLKANGLKVDDEVFGSIEKAISMTSILEAKLEKLLIIFDGMVKIKRIASESKQFRKKYDYAQPNVLKFDEIATHAQLLSWAGVNEQELRRCLADTSAKMDKQCNKLINVLGKLWTAAAPPTTR